jgi:hypothetical protein
MLRQVIVPAYSRITVPELPHQADKNLPNLTPTASRTDNGIGNVQWG